MASVLYRPRPPSASPFHSGVYRFFFFILGCERKTPRRQWWRRRWVFTAAAGNWCQFDGRPSFTPPPSPSHRTYTRIYPSPSRPFTLRQTDEGILVQRYYNNSNNDDVDRGKSVFFFIIIIRLTHVVHHCVFSPPPFWFAIVRLVYTRTQKRSRRG